MTLSAAFTVNGVANPAAHSAAYGSTVTLAITSLTGVDSVAFSIVGVSKSTQSVPALTNSGIPLGSTATFALPADPGDGLGRSFRVKCLVTNNASGEQAVSYGVVGAVNANGTLPIAFGEELDRNASYGWIDAVNSGGRSLAGETTALLSTSATAATNLAALQAAIDSLPSGGTVNIPGGLFDISAQVNMAAGITLRGVGKSVSRLRWSHTGRGIRMQSTVNSSSAVHISLRDLSLENTNGSNTDGGFVDNCGTFITLHNVRTVGWKYGVVLDQSELVDIITCDFETPIKAGVWLVNGDEYTATASTQFTNRININSDCQFNGGEFGILDDGGISHNFRENNHNGATVAHIRIAGTYPAAIVEGCEMEVGPVGIKLAALSESGDTASGAPSLDLRSNIIVVDDYSVEIDSAGVINADNNFLYGEYAFAGMQNCALANGRGNAIPGVSVKTIYQNDVATIHEDWVIPGTGSIVQNVFRKSTVTDLGLPLLWMLGDDTAAITDYSGTPDYFTSFENRGALGGDFSGASTNRPEISSFYTKLAPIFGNGGTYDNLLSSLAASNFAFLHNGVSSYTLTLRFRTTSLAATQTLFATFNSTLSNVGAYLYVTTGGAITLLMGNGSGSAALNIASAGSTIAINTNYTVSVVVNGTAAAVYVNGTSVATGTITSPSTAASTTTLYLGSHAGAVPLIGLLPEFIVQQGAQDAVQRSVMSTYIGRWA